MKTLTGIPRILVSALLTAALAAGAGSAFAQDVDLSRAGLDAGLPPDASSSYFAPAPGIGIQQATDIVRRDIGGRVLSANPRRVGQNTQYRVRVLVDGERVVTVTVDHNGRILRRR